MEIKVNYTNNRYALTKADADSAGYDLRARIDGNPIVLRGGYSVTLKTGVFLDIPKGYEGQVRGRSGLWFKHGITVGQEGTIDAGYHGEVGVKLHNDGMEDFVIEDGDRIAQIVFSKLPEIELSEIGRDEYDGLQSERGNGGFGHSGMK